jgi:uncharacterized protein (TIGR03437 family)
MVLNDRSNAAYATAIRRGEAVELRGIAVPVVEKWRCGSLRWMIATARSFLIVSAILARCALCQFSDLATNDDGSQLYFSSAMRLRGSQENTYPKIFRYSNGTFELYRQMDPLPSGRGAFYRLGGASVSGDGTVVGYGGYAPCFGGSSCIGVVESEGVIVRPGKPDKVFSDGSVWVSADRQFALGASDCSDSRGLNCWARVIDLATDDTTILTDLHVVGDGRQTLADNGKLVLSSASMRKFVLRTASSQLELQIPDTASLVRVNRRATTIVYEDGTNNFRWLIAYDLASGNQNRLATVRASGYQSPTFRPWLTSDGSKVVFLAADYRGIMQAFLINTDGSNLKQLTNDSHGILDVTISGFGNVIYASTATAGLLRIDLPSLATTELAPSSPLVTANTALVPGSLAELSGIGLGGVTTLHVGDLSAPIYSVSDTALVFQVPWEASTTPATRVDTGGQSPFETAITTPVRTLSPAFLPFFEDGLTPLVALHQDFGSLVSRASPALPGEIIHAFAVGLGPVDGTVQTGVPAPINAELQSAQIPLACSLTLLRGAQADVAVLFQGLAPGFVGLYQLDLSIPSSVSDYIGYITCTCSPTGSAPVTTMSVLPAKVSK